MATFLSSMYLHSAELPPLEKMKQGVECLNRELPRQNMPLILTLGPTGSCKSTLINYLRRKQLHGELYKKFGRTRYQIVADNPVDADVLPMGITSIPVTGMITQGSIRDNYCDVPGFESIEEGNENHYCRDILNAYSIYKTITPDRPVKFILTFPQNQDDRTTCFISSIDRIAEYLGDNCTDNICLVVTRAEEGGDATEFKQSLIDLFKEQKALKGGYTPGVRFLENLSKIPDKRIAFFYEHKGEGPVSDRDLPAINTAIEGADFKKMAARVAISPGSKGFIKTLEEKFSYDTSLIFEDFMKKLPECITEHIRIHRKNGAQGLRSHFQQIIHNLNMLDKFPEFQSFDAFNRNMNSMGQFLEKTDLESRPFYTRFQECRENFRFIETVYPDLKPIHNKSSIVLDAIDKILKNFAENPRPQINGSIITLPGFIVGTSDIYPVVEGKKFSRVNVHALHSFVVDRDLRMPGTNFICFAPYWWIEKHTIDLKGTDQDYQYPGRAADGSGPSMHGKDGLPGKPGQNGGNFYGKGLIFS